MRAHFQTPWISYNITKHLRQSIDFFDLQVAFFVARFIIEKSYLSMLHPFIPCLSHNLVYIFGFGWSL
jgi:hypothetical protein